jgi:nucleotide-binding universal stress UspA family protein
VLDSYGVTTVTYKTILVHLHDVRRAKRLLDAAIPLARQSGGHVIGLSVLPPYVMIPASESVGTSLTIDEHRLAYAVIMRDLKDVFSSVPDKLDIATEWREADAGFGTAAGMIVTHGRATDLIVVAQKEPTWSYSDMLEEPDRIASESGRPVLVVPNVGDVSLPPKRVIVAWNGTSESTRAVFDALPLLKTATAVNVVWIDPQRDRATAGDVPGAELCATLSRHGIHSTAIAAKAEHGDAGIELLEQVKAQQADLLVMGAYGHTRLRQFFLGGVSKHIFASMTCPVLLSH